MLVRGDYIFKMRFLTYVNPNSLDVNGDICDPGDVSNRQCDSKFNFCLREYDYSRTQRSHCPFGKFESGEVGEDNIDLTSSDSIGTLSNPLLFENSRNWMVINTRTAC